MMKDGKRLIRHDVIFELYQDQPTILKVDPAERDPSDPNQDSNHSSEQYLEDFDRQLGKPYEILIVSLASQRYNAKPIRVNQRTRAVWKILLLYRKTVKTKHLL
jgi:hypothetical protein